MMDKFLRRFPPLVQQGLRHAWMLLTVFLVTLAIIFTLFRALTPWVKQYRKPIQEHISVLLGQQVHIQDIDTSWYWFTPVLRMHKVALVDASQQPLRMDEVMVGINLLSSLVHWKIKPGLVYVEDAHFNIQQHADTWKVNGLQAAPVGQDATMTRFKALAFIETLLSQDKLIIRHVSMDIHLADGTKIPIQSLNVKADQSVGQYHLYAKAILAQRPKTMATVIADLNLDFSDLMHSSGQLYVSLADLSVQQWQAFMPETQVKLSKGNANLDVWLDVKNGHITRGQSVVELTDATLVEPSRAKPRKVSSLTANTAWQKEAEGWKLTADQVLFELDGVEWPDNQLMLVYHEPVENYRLYVKTLPLAQLLQTDIAWPKAAKSLLDLNPNGEFHDAQLAWQDGELHDALTRFSDMEWQAKDSIPGLTGLTGALYWQPSEGRLEVDGEHTVLSLQPPLAPLTFDTFNVALEWKDLSQGLRVSLDRLVVSHPNLVMSATGAIDDPTGPAANVRLQMDFAAKAAQHWLPYIPGKGLKPKLDAWLKQDIPRIDHATGHMVISGPWADFPFDNQNGEFSIHSHVSGVDLLINKKWPINRDIDADIDVDKRTLSVEIDQAKILDVPVKHVNLVVPNIGSGKEVLLLHGAVNAPGPQVKEYVFHSPLRQRLTRWKGLDIKRTLGLELNLEVPLYPESDHVYAKGALNFKNNPVSVQMVDNPASFEAVTGQLQFNEFGLTAGGLDGLLEGRPFVMRVQPLAGPKAGTELRFEGEATVDYLKELAHHPALSLMRGQMILTGLWTVYPSEPDMDKLYINSSLVGMAVDLPKPFGKTVSEITPLTVNIAFHPQHRMTLNLDYAARLNGNIEMKELANHSWDTSGDVHLGPGAASTGKTDGLQITGSLASVDVEEWKKVWSRWPQSNDTVSIMDSLRMVDLSIAKLKVLGETYPELRIKAHQSTPKEWSFHLDQKNVAGDFRYRTKKHSLSGHITHLDINPASTTSSSHTKWKPEIESIPNLDFSIDQLNYHGVDVGKVDVSSVTTPGHWILRGGTIQTPEYQLHLEGDWSQYKQEKPQSSLQAQLQLKNLSKALERWHITPAVAAHSAKMTFSGTWPAAFPQFKLKKLIGQMEVTVRDGRVSHLDRETEEKLALGKVLSILSLQTIPRRLKLDFSDLAYQGYSFDIFKGSFQIHKGVMSTKDSYIDGPVAYGRINGDLDLVHQLYDLDLRITPYITASLPVVATIAGGPVAGLATWAVSSLVSKGMQKVSGYSYKISGPWMNPVVQQVSIDHSKSS
ncbi:MAG: TIGR02099 family protein [Gammaproteobacteria bacterium]|nr:TIGR02099 family protein [Gammaproteobacteria bacterium]